MEREREVFPTREIAHLWVHQMQYFARNPKGDLLFRGTTIYSYGRHFPIAKLLRKSEFDSMGRTYLKSADDFENYVLFTDVSYSNSTDKHIRYVMLAIPGNFTIIPVVNMNAGHSSADEENLRNYVNRMRINMDKYLAARTNKGIYLQKIEWYHLAFKRYKTLFKVPNKRIERKHIEYFKEIDEFFKNGNVEYFKELKRKEKEAQTKAREKQKELFFERLNEWRKGKDVYLPEHLIKHFLGGNAVLKVVGDKVVTSKGNRLSYKNSKQFYQKIYTAVREGKAKLGRGVKIDGWRIDEVTNSGGVVAGCTKVTAKEIGQLAENEGWK